MIIRALIATLVLSLSFFSYASNDEEKLIQKYSQSLFKIRTVDKDTNSEMTYGTGFLLDNEGYAISNYHVVSDFINDKDAYVIEAERASDKKTTRVEVINFDMANDLALLKISDIDPNSVVFNIGNTEAIQGSTLYSLGNPRRIGTIIVEGTHNGLLDGSQEEKINFTGSINPGMSGGPTIDANENLVGVNVETSFNGVGYLVNVKHAKALYLTKNSKVNDFDSEIEKQVGQWASKSFDSFFGSLESETNNDVKIVKTNLTHYQCMSGASVEFAPSRLKYKEMACIPRDTLYLSDRTSISGLSLRTEIFRTLEDKDSFSKNAVKKVITLNEESFKSEVAVCDSEWVESNNKIYGMQYCIRKHDKLDYLTVFDIKLTYRVHADLWISYTLSTEGLNEAQNNQIAKDFIEKVAS